MNEQIAEVKSKAGAVFAVVFFALVGAGILWLSDSQTLSKLWESIRKGPAAVREATPVLHPQIWGWMNDDARRQRAAWDAAHPNPNENGSDIILVPRPMLTFLLIGDQKVEIGIRNDGVIVWRKFEE